MNRSAVTLWFLACGLIVGTRLSESLSIRRKMTMVCLLVVLSMLATPQSSAEKIAIDGLGEIALPDGKWGVELVHRSTPAQKTPDVFILRKVGDKIERITILRYPPEIKMLAYVYCDSTADSTFFGIPRFLESEYDKLREKRGEAKVTLKKDAVIEMVRIPTNFDSKHLEMTNVYTDSTEMNWMNNAIISESDECVFVMLQSAPRVLLPETLSECFLASELLPPE